MNQRVSTALPFTKLPVGKIWDGVSGHYDNSNLQKIGIVLHRMDGSVAGTTAWFCNNSDPRAQVSSNYGVGLDGNLYQWVPENATAYHAGKYAINQTFIGIEHEDLGDANSHFSDALYTATIRLIADICKFYGWSADKTHIMIHSEIKSTSCPGNLDRDRIIAGVQKLLTAPPPPATTPVTPVQTTLISDQVKVHIGTNQRTQTNYGDMELGAVRSTIFDLENSRDEMANRISIYQNQVTLPKAQATGILEQIRQAFGL